MYMYIMRALSSFMARDICIKTNPPHISSRRKQKARGRADERENEYLHSKSLAQGCELAPSLLMMKTMNSIDAHHHNGCVGSTMSSQRSPHIAVLPPALDTTRNWGLVHICARRMP